MSKEYLVAKCSRCGSTLRLSENAVRSELFLCPVCLEGEIEYVSIQNEVDYHEIIESIHTNDLHCAVPLKVSTN